jgi:class 3 adenylate cyclase/tetratricopeptide (TPR) repeat protein
MRGIAEWLASIGLGEYAQRFAESAIDLSVVRDLTEHDLKELGVLLGHRRKMLRAIAELNGVAPAPTGPATEPVLRGEAERRHLTVMICDLVGSTALSARLDPEDMNTVMDDYHAACARIMVTYDGFIGDFRGDGILAYFGYPRAHEDDAERAVRAGLDIIAAVARLETRAAVPLAVRIGIATGLVVVGDLSGESALREHALVGDTPNLAARLQALAEPGTIVLAGSTRRLLGDLFHLRDLGCHEVKGIAEPVAAWAVEGLSASESRFEAVRVARLTDLVGREDEIDYLLERQRLAWKGEGQIVLISGEPGIGKSRLAATLAERITGEPYMRLRYQCSPYHTNSALRPFIDQLERAAGIKADDTSEQRLDKLEAVLATGVSRDLTVAPLFAALLSISFGGRYPPLALNPMQQRRRTLAALLDQFEGLARRQPILLFFEDAHWADATSLELLDLAVERVRQLPVFALFTFRPEFEPPWVGLPNVGTLTLRGLDPNDVESMVVRVTGGRGLPEEVMKQIVAKTDGNPLFVEELTKAVLETGILVEDAEGYRLDGPLPPLAIPETLQDSLMARLDRLAPVKEIGQIGAAIGREFSYPLVRALVGRDETALKHALAQLEQAGLVFRRGEPPEAVYNFKHALVRDAAYESLLKSRRRQLHSSIAKVLVERFPATAERLPEVVAHHFTEAEFASEAIGYWLKAGRLASARSANLEAAKSFEQALHVLKALPESQSTLEQGFELRLELRLVLSQLGKGQRMLECLREAEALAERLNDDRRRCRVYAFMTVTHSLLGELDEALVTGSLALEIGERLGDLGLRILATSYFVQVNYLRGEYDRVIELATGNLAALPADRVYENFGLVVPPSVWDRTWLVMSLAELGRFGEAAKYEAEATRLAQPTQHAFTIGFAHFTAGMLHLLQGDWTQARSRIEGLVAVARTGNLILHLPRAVASSAWALAQLGETSEALNRLREGEQLLERQAASGIAFHRAWGYHALGRAALGLHRLDEARRLAYRGIETSQGYPGFAAHALHLLGDIASHPDQFDAESGKAHYRQALALAKPSGMRPLVAHCHLGLGKLYGRIGDHQQAQEHLTMATAMYREMAMTYWVEQVAAKARQLG